MDLNVEHQLGAVERSVLSLGRQQQPARAVTLSRTFATTVQNLWDAVTNGERIPLWFLPISGALELGGRYQLEGNAGGLITACERPSHVALTWEFGEDVSWVEVLIADKGAAGARLTLTHTAHVSEHWEKYGPGAVGIGWELGLMGLENYLSHPTEPKPDEAAVATSRAGKALIKGSSERWERAAVVSGMDPDLARAAARRTTAFYTGDSDEGA